MKLGKFISFEGTEGVGKTTAIHRLCQRLDSLNIDFICTREPGGSPLAEKLRDIFLDHDSCIDADAEILLMFAARADHLNKVIVPALTAGKWVVCDRFFDSTVAYQGFGRFGGQSDKLEKIELLIQRFVSYQPDVTLWLDLDVEIGMMRADKRGGLDRIEKNNLEFFKKVYEGLVYQQSKHPERIHRIDASKDELSVSLEIEKVLGLDFLI